MFSSMRSRPREKGIVNEYDMKEIKSTEKTVTCSPKLRCQDSFEKLTSCSSNKKLKNYAENPSSAIDQYLKTIENYSDYTPRHSVTPLPHPDEYRYSMDESFSSLSVSVRKTDVFLERDEECSLGITLQGGIHPNPSFSRPLFVTNVKPGGPADKEGTIQIGDRILAIDGYLLNNVTLNDAYNILKQFNNRTSARLSIEYDVTNIGHFSGPLVVEMESPHPHQLGLTLTNTPHNAAVLIDEIRIGSIAERCGALHSGDQILAVNETRIEGSKMAATEVYKLLRICGGSHPVLLLEILPFSSFARNQLITTDSIKQHYYHLPVVPQYDVPEEYISSTSQSDLSQTKFDKNCSTKQLTLTLHSDDKVGYGINVCCFPNDSRTYIQSIIPGSVADMCEILQVNDIISSVNGSPISGVTTEPQPLHKVPGIPLGSITVSIIYSVNPAYSELDGIFTIVLTKRDKRNLGITMSGCRECMLISDIKPGSVADRSGSMAPGDRILSINNQMLINCTVQEAIDILHSQSDAVALEIQKQDKTEPTNESVSSDGVEYTVELNKQGGQLGITITGSENIPREIIISALVPGGLARRTDALHVGDRVLAIDGKNTCAVLLSEAISYLQNSKDKVFIKVSRPSALQDNSSSENSSGRIYGSPGLCSTDSAIESWESSIQDPSNELPFSQLNNNLQECKLGDIGDKNIPVECRIASLSPQSTLRSNKGSNYNSLPACAPHHYDRNVSPCYHQCLYTTNQQFGTDDDSARNMKNGMLYDENVIAAFNCDIDKIFSITDLGDKVDFESEVHQVTLFKDPLYEDFGFSVSDGLYERGVFINRIRPGGPADSTGLLRPFDRIIRVNGTRTDNFDCCLTVPLVASAGYKVTLTVVRQRMELSDTQDSVKQMRWYNADKFDKEAQNNESSGATCTV